MKLEDLGFSREELQQRVVDQAVEKLLQQNGWDAEEGEFTNDTQMKKRMDNRIREMIDAKINALAVEHVLPNVHEYIDKFTLQETTAWGEKKGEPMTFTEYLVKRAEAYMQEQVDFDGKGQKEKGSYDWQGRTTRLAYMIDKHIHYNIERAAKTILGSAHEQIGLALKGAVEQAVANVVRNIGAAVKK